MVDYHGIIHRAQGQTDRFVHKRGDNVKGTSTNNSLKRMLARAPKGTKLNR
jgi:hypothetical protein